MEKLQIKYIEEIVFNRQMPFKYFEETKKNKTKNKDSIIDVKNILINLVTVLEKINDYKQSKTKFSEIKNKKIDNNIIYTLQTINNEFLKNNLKSILTQIFVSFNIPWDNINGNASIEQLLNYIESYKDIDGKAIFKQMLSYNTETIKKIINKYLIK